MQWWEWALLATWGPSTALGLLAIIVFTPMLLVGRTRERESSRRREKPDTS